MHTPGLESRAFPFYDISESAPCLDLHNRTQLSGVPDLRGDYPVSAFAFRAIQSTVGRLQEFPG
jgi:hypothetical protein